MRAADLSFAPADFLRLIEEVGLTGSWGWVFTSDIQTWSPGLYRLLGLDPERTRPTYDLLAGTRPSRRPAHAADMLQGYALPEQRVRVVRPDGSLRTLAMRTELHLTPEGRPRAAAGIALDVTDPTALMRLRQAESRRRNAWFAQGRVMFVSVGLDRRFDFSSEAAQLTGRPLDEVNADPFAEVVPDERMAVRDSVAQRGLFQGMPLVGHRNREPERYRILSVPVRDGQGRVVERSGLVYPAALSCPPVAEGLRTGLEQAVEGYHLRAARALLDWSMTDLAEARGLSLSTVRRLEENAEGQGARSRHKAIAALRRAGIRFVLLDDGEVAVARA